MPNDPWPWYVSGPLIGLVIPALLLLGGRSFGVSANLRHMCAAVLPSRPRFLQYDWWRDGAWNLSFALGIVLGGWIAGRWLSGDGPLPVAAATRADLAALGLSDPVGLVPGELFALAALGGPTAWLALGLGGVLVGFGARWAGGCTSGHLTGLADRQLASLLAMAGFFVGGLVATHWLLPMVLR